ncbi:FkbM family methyltransferase [Moorena sp. SIO4A5]|uniref:FkbM family methyltransferase n=1 Tax=Moorena sp. SIO4A5 TaxID=2607838 RepID=UPI0013C8AF62|nr:FkbM family methyltransferase [Moorena sp. SIO4A5]NEO21430.1 FkbM family methyltransferase [Moorena sp. SIO4A5]
MYGVPDYIKLDIEGYEVNALRGLSYAIKFISFEANLPVFFDETLECLSILSKFSSSVIFAYSLEEGLFGELSSWLNYEQLVNIISEKKYHFLEIIACLSPSDVDTYSNSHNYEVHNFGILGNRQEGTANQHQK